MANKVETGLGRSSLYLIYTHFLHKAFLEFIYIILNYNS